MALPSTLLSRLLGAVACVSVVLASGCASDAEAPAPDSDEEAISLSEADSYARALLPWQCVASKLGRGLSRLGLCPDIRERPDMALSAALLESDGTPGPVLDSPFPYACPTCSIRDGKPITNLVDEALVREVSRHSCETDKDHAFAPFFPGIQGFNDSQLAPGPLTALAGDEAAANMYIKFALRSTSADSVSVQKKWSLLYNFNMPSVVRSRPGMPVSLPPLSGDTKGAGVRVHARKGHSTSRSRTNADGTHFGDEVEVRLLGLWAATANDQDFVMQRPSFAVSGARAEVDRKDFELFRKTVIASDDFRDFMYRATYESAIALKCGTPIYAHSGGGSVMAFVVRLLTTSALREELAGWKNTSAFVGLEATLSEGLERRATALIGHPFPMRQLLVSKTGSGTYVDKITPAILSLSDAPLANASVTQAVDPPGYSGFTAHVGIGMYALAYGAVPIVAE